MNELLEKRSITDDLKDYQLDSKLEQDDITAQWYEWVDSICSRYNKSQSNIMTPLVNK